MIFKYPRTQHLKGSNLQEGDHDLEAVDIKFLANKHLVVEEKMDGANTGMSFVDGELRLQSRGHYLVGGPREKHFGLFKTWAATHAAAFRELLKDRYVMYGEWMWAKHTVFYDDLPHYFMEFDILDTERNVFLSTEARDELIRSAGLRHKITSVEVVGAGDVWSIKQIEGSLKRSLFKTIDWERNLEISAQSAGVDPKDVMTHTDPSSDAEGLYIKWEEDDIVRGRYKFVRKSFTNSILDQEEHWLNRPIIHNVLKKGAYDRLFE